MRRARLDLFILIALVAGTAVWSGRTLQQDSKPLPPIATAENPATEFKWTQPSSTASSPPLTITATPMEPLLDQQQVEFEKATESAILRSLGQAVVDSRRTYSYSFTNLGVDSRPASTGARLTHSLTQLALPMGASVPVFRISAIHLYVRELLTPEQQKQSRALVLNTLRQELAGGARLDLMFGQQPRR